MKNKIIFTTELEGLMEFPELYPQPASKYIPEWYKKLPTEVKLKNDFNSKVIPNLKTIKTCPSFADIFKEGFVLLSPCDLYFRIDNDGFWQWQTPDPDIKIDVHEDEQFVNYFKEKNVRKVFKLVSPWYAITPKGWSIRQVPNIYDFNKDWQVAYGILNSDVEHELNQQIIYTSDKNEILIKKGSVLNYIVPFKRNETLNYEVKKADKELKNYINKSKRLVKSSFRTAIPYYRHS